VGLLSGVRDAVLVRAKVEVEVEVEVLVILKVRK
jgi:hypothetical protein